MSSLTENQAYQVMFELLANDEFMENKIPFEMFSDTENLATKEGWIKHICEQEKISREDWEAVILTYLFMGYGSKKFIDIFKKGGEPPHIPSAIKKAVSICLKKKKWDTIDVYVDIQA